MQPEDPDGDPPPDSAAPIRVALLTPPGRAALAVVGVAGAGAAAAVDRLVAPSGAGPIAGRDDRSIAVRTWRTRPGEPGERVVVVRRRADLVEVHGHGGLAAPAAVLASLVDRGAVAVPWQEWADGEAAGRIAIEARAALARAGGPKAARILARQLCGALDHELARIARLVARGDAPAAAAAAERLVRAARVGLRLVRPWRVVLTGRVNAGKSSLANALAGHARSLVSPLPGTTRDVLETRLVVAGWEIDLVDTAGLRAGAIADPVERAGVARALAALAGADLVVHVAASTDPDMPRLEAAPGALLVATKADLLPAGTAVRPDAVATSAVTGTGIAALAARIVAALVPEERAEPDLLAGPVPFTPRQVAEIRRFCGPTSRG